MLPQIADPKKMKRDEFMNKEVNPELYKPDATFPDLYSMEEVPQKFCLEPALVPNNIQPVLNQDADMHPRAVIERWFGNPFKKELINIRQIVRHGKELFSFAF